MNINVTLWHVRMYSGPMYFTLPGLTRTTALLPSHCYLVINVIVIHVYDHVVVCTY